MKNIFAVALLLLSFASVAFADGSEGPIVKSGSGGHLYPRTPMTVLR
jgi:hypothetical protein